jgi:hypothetical protein
VKWCAETIQQDAPVDRLRLFNLAGIATLCQALLAAWAISVGGGCAGLLEVQGQVLASPDTVDVKNGGAFNVHMGVSEETELPIFGIGGTVKVDVTEVHAVVEQGAHGFLLTEMDEGWTLYGRIGGSAGMMPTESNQFSISAFSQFGTMYCLDEKKPRCISGGLHSHYTALFDGDFMHGPWLGLFLGFGSYWIND